MKDIYEKIKKELLSGENEKCQDIANAASEIAGDGCAKFVNEMEGEDKDYPCPCSGDGGADGDLVDLIVLVDSSGSMSGAWTEIEKAVVAAQEAAEKSCGKKAEVYPLFVDRNDAVPDANQLTSFFTKSHEQYLIDAGYTGPFHTESSDAPATTPGFPPEEGAEAIFDLCHHFPWRDGACRAIFYVSDEWLDGSGDPTDLNSPDNEPRAKRRVPEALAAAMANGVTLFAHHMESGAGNANVPASNQLYHDMCDPTGGFVIDGQNPSAKLYEEVFSKAICEGCANACPAVEWPEISPCVHISWGASKCDSIESHDDEVICITLCNCYSNVTFQNVRIGYVVVVDEKGNLPPLLPDGSPSVHIYPTGPICYGDIGPCEDGEETCVSRQFVMLTRGARDGNYTVKIGGLCFETCQDHLVDDTERHFKICKDG